MSCTRIEHLKSFVISNCRVRHEFWLLIHFWWSIIQCIVSNCITMSYGTNVPKIVTLDHKYPFRNIRINYKHNKHQSPLSTNWKYIVSRWSCVGIGNLSEKVMYRAANIAECLLEAIFSTLLWKPCLMWLHGQWRALLERKFFRESQWSACEAVHHRLSEVCSGDVCSIKTWYVCRSSRRWSFSVMRVTDDRCESEWQIIMFLIRENHYSYLLTTGNYSNPSNWIFCLQTKVYQNLWPTLYEEDDLGTSLF